MKPWRAENKKYFKSNMLPLWLKHGLNGLSFMIMSLNIALMQRWNAIETNLMLYMRWLALLQRDGINVNQYTGASRWMWCEAIVRLHRHNVIPPVPMYVVIIQWGHGGIMLQPRFSLYRNGFRNPRQWIRWWILFT